MRKYVLDTNLYVNVRAFRSEEGAAELERYYADFTPNTYLSSIVLHELLVGASTVCGFRKFWHQFSGKFGTRGFVGLG